MTPPTPEPTSTPPNPLLQSKLTPPRLTSRRVARPALESRRRALFDVRLALVSAPAGFGKTSLAAAWFDAMRRDDAAQLAWLALDAGENDPVRLATHLLAALADAPGRQAPLAAGVHDLPELAALVLARLNAVAAAGPLIVALDDVHALENPQAEQLLTALVDGGPPNVHFLLLSRVDPALPLARWRARGDLLEIRQRDLRFDAQETAALLAGVFGSSIEPDDVETLLERTEGWAAGLQLAALALPHDPAERVRFIATFAGTHRHVIDYLTDEVWARLSPDVQQFLLETGILDRLSGPCCDAVRAASDSQQMLEQVERENLFVVPLDDARVWYRYHHLFADLLRQRASQRLPDVLPTLHRRAAVWFADYARHEHDDEAANDALRHALASGDAAFYAGLVERFADGAWERGEHDKLAGWLAGLSDAALAERPALATLRAWGALTTGRFDESRRWLDAADAALGDGSNDELRGRVAATRAFLATLTGDVANLGRYAGDALERLGDSVSSWRGSAAIALGDSHLLRGAPSAAEAGYREGLRVSLAQGNVYLALNAAYKLASALRQRASLLAAYDTCHEALRLAEAHGLAQTSMAGCLYALTGEVLSDWNRVDEALAQTALGMAASAHSRHVGLAGQAAIYRLRVLLVAHDFATFDAELAQFTEQHRAARLPPWVDSPLIALRGLRWLTSGDLAQTAAWVQARGLSADAVQPGRLGEYVVLARLLLAQGQADAAAQLAARLMHSLNRDEHTHIAVLLLMLRALASERSGDHAAASAYTGEALRLAEPGRYVQPWLEGGGLMARLVEAARDAAPAYAQTVLAAFPAADADGLADPLSARELDVLRLMADGLTNQAIADALVVSLNTVLYHSKNIFGKLGVARRTQAVNRARELGLL